jgi:hypothetical protein
MASMNVKTDVQGPDAITINLVREDYLETSNTFRIFFEICLAITGAILGSIISLNDQKSVSFINWFFLIIMIGGCISFLVLTSKHYKKAKCQSNNE